MNAIHHVIRNTAVNHSGRQQRPTGGHQKRKKKNRRMHLDGVYKKQPVHEVQQSSPVIGELVLREQERGEYSSYYTVLEACVNTVMNCQRNMTHIKSTMEYATGMTRNATREE